ncbi:hypothetical protein ACSBR2_029844 [Camellia fascicularis]
MEVEHCNHPHPLTPSKKKGDGEEIVCNRCCRKILGSAYCCRNCSFFLHIVCLKPPTWSRFPQYHHHPLFTLRLTPIKEENDDDEEEIFCKGCCQKIVGSAICSICKKRLNTNFWFYSCKICGYDVHVNCRTKTKFRESNTTIKIEDLDMATLIHLPLLPNESVNLIAQFVKQMNLDDNNREVKLEQFSHSHPLTLCNLDNDDLLSGSELSILNKQNIDKICDVCVQPINASFYNCNQCNFFVHEWCSKLADKFRLVRNEIFNCYGCATRDCIGFQFSLEYWDSGDPRYGYQLDVKCASLPSSIMHKAHEHPLILKKIGENEGCAACDQIRGMLSFGCGISPCSFNLHCGCALLPSIFNHRYDEHPFILTYAPIENGPDEYWCEFCENQVDPEWWFYHCTYCDKSACAKCIRKKEFPNAKLGATYTFASHPHPLTLIQATYMRVRCDVCNRRIVRGNGAFKCEHCEIMLCKTCVCCRPTAWKVLSDFEDIKFR